MFGPWWALDVASVSSPVVNISFVAAVCSHSGVGGAQDVRALGQGTSSNCSSNGEGIALAYIEFLVRLAGLSQPLSADLASWKGLSPDCGGKVGCIIPEAAGIFITSAISCLRRGRRIVRRTIVAMRITEAQT